MIFHHFGCRGVRGKGLRNVETYDLHAGVGGRCVETKTVEPTDARMLREETCLPPAGPLKQTTVQGSFAPYARCARGE